LKKYSTFTSVAFLVLLLVAMGHSSAEALGFEGSYDPSNWTLFTGTGDGSVDTSLAPSSIDLRGSDTGSGDFITTTFTIGSPGDGTVSFSWDYDSFNVDGPFFDPAGFVLNGLLTQLTNDGGPDVQSGVLNVLVSTGDVFGFYVSTLDDALGEALISISNFSAPAASIPEPGTFLLMGTGLIGLIGFGWRKRKQEAVLNDS